MTMTALDVNTNPTPSRAPGALTIRTDVDVDREEEEEEEDWSPDSLFDEPMEAETERTSPRTPPSVHILAQATPSTQALPPAPTQAAPPPPPPAPRAIPPIPSAPGAHERVARRTCPPIPGLYFDPGARLARARAERVRAGCMRAFFGGEADRADRANQANQVMLFGRAGEGEGEGEDEEGEGEGGEGEGEDEEGEGEGEGGEGKGGNGGKGKGQGLPAALEALGRELAGILRGAVGAEAFRAVFGEGAGERRARQAIVNLYAVGEGIGDHVDLVGRYGEGIVGVGTGSGCVMRFLKVRAGGAGEGEVGEGEGEGERWDVYVPEGGIVALTGEARYRWTHGIEGRAGDWVEAEDGEDGEGEGGARPVWVPRKARVSVTFRWMLPGADVVGA